MVFRGVFGRSGGGFVQQFVQHFEVWILSVRGLDFFSLLADSAALSWAPLSCIPYSLLIWHGR